MSAAQICLVCGASGSGKTTALMRLLDELKAKRTDCRGIICPPVFENGEKNGIDLMDVVTGEKFRLAERNLSGETFLATHGWILNAQAVQTGNNILRSVTPCDILFIDELGPLEYERGEGLLEGFSAINTHAYRMAFVTIRPSLLSAAMERWPDAHTLQIDQYPQDALVQELRALVRQP